MSISNKTREHIGGGMASDAFMHEELFLLLQGELRVGAEHGEEPERDGARRRRL